ncbi:hypothetical protein RB596_003013 [Gaeumannomyces avenae]
MTPWGMNAFITMSKASVGIHFLEYGQEDLLGPNLQWTIMKGRATLDSASKETARQHFLEKVAAHSVERGGEGIGNPNVIPRLSRFRGDMVLINAGPESPIPSLDSGEEEQEIYEVEGCTVKDVGWVHTQPSYFCENYEELMWNCSHRETWRRFYRRLSPDVPSEEEEEHLLSVDLLLQSS